MGVFPKGCFLNKFKSFALGNHLHTCFYHRLLSKQLNFEMIQAFF